jgi:Asp-tRNA(Asn)/Glu-tRNA(Gln) amidotransferase C subunit
MREEYKVTITAEQVKELAQLVDQNHHTEAMLNLTEYVYDAFEEMYEFDESKGYASPQAEYYAHYEMALYERWKLMKAIQDIHEKFNQIPRKCYDLRYELMNETLACIKNEEEVRGCL